MIERLKYLRKELLKLSQKNFGENIGLKQNSYSNIENARIFLTERNINAICQTFNVNEEWLRNGTEPIFKEDTEEIDPLNALAIKYKLNKEETILLKKFAELNGNTRQSILSFMIDFVNDINSQNNKK